MRGRAAIVGMLVALVATSVASARQPHVTGASAKQRELLLRLWTGMPGTPITAVALYRARRLLTIRFNAGANGSERIAWEEYVLAVGFRDASAAAKLPLVQWIASKDGGSRLDDDVPVSPPAPSGPSARVALETTARTAVAAAGGTIEELRVFTLRGLALMVRMRVTNGAAFLKNDAASLISAFRNAAKIGWYLEVADSKGSVLITDNAWIEQSHVYGRGSLRVRPDLRSCSPFVTGVTLGTPIRHMEPAPPPCPA